MTADLYVSRFPSAAWIARTSAECDGNSRDLGDCSVLYLQFWWAFTLVLFLSAEQF